MRVLLRCDARPSTGIGHVVRAVALAGAVRRRGGEATLVGTVDVPLARRIVTAAGLDLVPAGEGPAGVPTEVLRSADVVHLDTYDTMSTPSDVLVSSLEDGVFGRRRADVVVDPSLAAYAQARPEDGSGLVLAGPRYSPLRAQVRRARRVRAQGAGGHVVVVMGGTDAVGAAGAAVRLALRAGATRVTAIDPAGTLGPDEPRVTALRAVDDLAQLVVDADVVVSAAGTTVHELACIGVPMALVPVVANQAESYRYAVEAGIALGLGPVHALLADAAVAARLRALVADPGQQESLARRGRQLVDGAGADRVVDAWAAALGAGPRARPAGRDDAARLLAWRNDPVTRAASRSTEPVTVEAHERWLDGVLADPSRTLLVVEDPTGPLGTVRFDARGNEEVEVSLALAPERRGGGLAVAVLAAALAHLRATARPMPSVLAYVRPDNAASLRLFQRAGFRHAADEDGMRLLALD
ncbi:GNAT family N-acetyltransferase [Cellulomonas sp. JZ18]|uniref:bifunctional UDP-2,4-diacetamido-2,4,6-trideoxy-beta-L-altropyranose hydrolase/GNAT family N-acetyltransferase n=1 Tax=Cellulomonas sp. JZ18 TaxID=2654191 RepID=UPI0012D42CF7|nr:bifunctional UDP-2,4-diacetamido-2,4,6-trideoxy-beta-L-altropyranose hydrolase/GNAT family N-acetyltransferase [Cellulomonas sp. JZ18]QGQ20257.1 GNAT family N-acetyltransferase [Cellulomonas sp. JZ18]